MIGNWVDLDEARKIAAKNKHRVYRSSGKGDSGFERTGREFPELKYEPKFRFAKDTNFFTIGSCFAREIENQLALMKIPCLTSKAKFPPELFEIPKVRPDTGALNAYTPASMSSLVTLLDRPDFQTAGSIDFGDEEHADMMLSGLRFLSADEFATARGILVDTYRGMKDATAVIVTLGYTESWYDQENDIYINRAPAAHPKTARLKDRFKFKNLAHSDVVDCLDKIIAKIRSITNERANIVVTVSPVPLGSTFTKMDVVTANTYSKSTLHSAAITCIGKYDYVDYFPSYEIVTSQPRDKVFKEDGAHVQPQIVSGIMNAFATNYIEA